MMRYKGGAKTLRDIAKENGLNAVVEATVFRAGDVMRINVQFTDPVTSKSLWAETFDRDVKDVLAAEADVVDRIAKGVGAAMAKPINEATNDENEISTHTWRDLRHRGLCKDRPVAPGGENAFAGEPELQRILLVA